MFTNFNVYIFRYDVMTRCWNLNPEFRPPFENLRKKMDTYLREEVCSNETIINRGQQNSMDLFKDHDDYNYRITQLYSLTKKKKNQKN